MSQIIHTGMSADLAAGGRRAIREMQERVTKPAMVFGAFTFHQRRYFVRFGAENSQYTSRRRKDYNRWKIKKFGHKKGLVRTGELRSVMHRIRISAVTKRKENVVRVTITFPGARMINRFNEKTRTKITKELTKIRPRDQKVFDMAVKRMAERKMRLWEKSNARLVKRFK